MVLRHFSLTLENVIKRIIKNKSRRGEGGKIKADKNFGSYIYDLLAGLTEIS